MSIIVSPSILSADLADLKNDIRRLEESGADRIHFDVMDGVFVNNISFGIPVLKSVKNITDMFIDVHFMIIDPMKYVDSFVDAGADMITFHTESNVDIKSTIDKIHSRGIKAGLTVKPTTPIETVYEYLPFIENVLVMSVEPGFGGQGFIHDTMKKVSDVKKIIIENNYNCLVQVDGGINDVTARIAIEAGADDIVSGTYLFKAENMKDAVQTIKSIKNG